jgi:hypothetical protein
MSIAKESNPQQHVTMLGWLYLLGHALFLLVGLFIFTLLTSLGLTVPDPQARAVLLIVGPSVGLLLVMLALPGLAAGYGLLTRRPWARVLAIVVGILGLPNFPIGTAIGLYALWGALPHAGAQLLHQAGRSIGMRRLWRPAQTDCLGSAMLPGRPTPLGKVYMSRGQPSGGTP